MCVTCGCSDHTLPTHKHEHPHSHDHGHDPEHSHAPYLQHDSHPQHEPDLRLLHLEHAVLSRNAHLAAHNREWLDERRIFALNLVSSPGSGKTTLLERTIADTAGRATIGVLQGDQETDNDAIRIRRAGAKSIQINTGKGCHLDASMIARSLPELDPPPRSILVIENVGNLVCPALFELGEHVRVAVLSVTEGTDKPLKYPYLFRGSHVVLINKVDLAPYVDFDIDACKRNVRRVNPDAVIHTVSAKTGEGLDPFYDFLTEARS
ncbi:MAG TPA: hydrogenase nickel incorporation protein HypB [Polyangiaceae bacterium]|nr:hydrogenase nickel incorporation protein HypB [Polyangiaceae bacterium]